MLNAQYFSEPTHPLTYAYNDDLNSLVGLESVKAEVKRLANFSALATKRAQSGLPPLTLSKHIVLTGHPGTGKTTVARIIARVFKEHGLLSKGHCVEVDRSSLVGQYIGHSEKHTMERINEALGGVLFIDEFYALAKDGNDFGGPVIDILVKQMEDKRDNLSVIVAGYTEPMKKAINSNPGLKSRFTRFIHFPDYEPKELLLIFDNMLKKAKYELHKDAYPLVWKAIRNHHANRKEDFGNARDMRTFFERLTDVHANRVMTDNSSITLIKPEDIVEAAALCGM